MITAKIRTRFFLLALSAILAYGCTGRFLPQPEKPATVRDKHFVVVTVTAQDTLEGLAKTHLGDNRKGWWIAKYNQIEKLEAGQRLVIPLQPFAHGGLSLDGYQTVPVLHYPCITTVVDKSRSVTASTFERHLALLKQDGFVSISLEQLDAFLNLKDQLPPKSVLISFDSADRWVYEVAYPSMKRNGFTAAIFIPTDQIGKSQKITWPELADMAINGFDIGAQAHTARDLTKPTTAEENAEAYLEALELEIAEPQKSIVKNLKQPCLYFAYPYGKTNDLVTALLKKHGYRAAFTRKRGSNPFFEYNFRLRRTTVFGQFDAQRFRQNLTTFRPAELR